MASETVDVLIAGGGPVGLFLALSLKHFYPEGRFVVLDKEEHLSKYSKALAVNPRSLEIFQYLNLVPGFVSKGCVVKRLHVHLSKNGELTELLEGNVTLARSPYPFMVMIEQFLTEEILSEACQARGIEIRRGVELESFSSTSEGVECVTNSHNSSPNTMAYNSRFLVGCDGAHSIVRHTLHFEMEGKTRSETLLMADVRVDSDIACFKSEKEPAVFINPEFGIAVFLPLTTPGDYRVLLNLIDDEDIKRFVPKVIGVDKHAAQGSEVTLEDIQTRINKRIVGGKCTVSDPKWLTMFKVNERLASGYVDPEHNNVMIMGDAAHVHSPMLGLGMNTGMQDAFNLSWKLAAILRNQAFKKPLIQSYVEERQNAARTVLAKSGAATGLFLQKMNFFSRIMLNYVISPLLPLVQDHLPVQSAIETNTLLNFAYPDSSPLVSSPASKVSKLPNGMRAPTIGSWVDFAHPEAKKTPLDVYSSSKRHQVFVFDLHGQKRKYTADDSRKIEKVIRIMKELSQQNSSIIERHLVVAGDHPPVNEIPSYWSGSQLDGTWTHVWSDQDGKTVEYYEFSNELPIVLVRPDGHIGFQGAVEDGPKLLEFLKTYLN